MSARREIYDYIVAGAGSAGCVLAARLAEDPGTRVLLLEAGEAGRTPFIAMPAGNGYLFGNPRYDWGYSSVPQAGLGGRRIYFPRGKGLGGSSIMNGMIYIRGNRRDYDGWRERGLEHWGFADLLPYFRRAEGSLHRDGAWHGAAGPLKTSLAGNFTPLDRLFVEAACRTGSPMNEDFNAASQHGVGHFDVTVSAGRRQSTAAAYLAKRPANLTVRTGARITGIEIEAGRATAVRVAGSEIMRAEREIIVCLGAFASPQLLMLSGIGPADHLRAHGISVAADLPGVGSSLADHINVPVQYACRDPALTYARYQRLDRALWLGARWWFSGRGPAAAPFWSTCLFGGSGDEVPDIQVFFTPMVVQEARDGDAEVSGILERLGRRILVRGSKQALNGFQFDINLLHPDGCGEVRLGSPDPLAPPRIDPRYFSGRNEMTTLVAGLRRVREIVAHGAFDRVRGAELSPGREFDSDSDLESAIRRVATTGHHPVGTCRMGSDADAGAVVDGTLKVRGIERLRVCDASIFPDQISGNPNAAIIMIAEKAADMIRGLPPLAPAEMPLPVSPR